MTLYTTDANGSNSEDIRLSPITGQTPNGEAVIEFNSSARSLRLVFANDAELVSLLAAVTQALTRQVNS